MAMVTDGEIVAQRAFVGYWFKIARHELKPHG
jgi:hypothetical protein